MGAQSGGGYATSPSSPEQFGRNVDRLIREFPVDAQGKFGVKGKGKSQRIYDAAPEAAARKFYETLGAGGDFRPIPGKGYLRWFDDGTHVSYRPVSSSDGTPVIEITVYTQGSKLAPYQKIHFMKGPAR